MKAYLHSKRAFPRLQKDKVGFIYLPFHHRFPEFRTTQAPLWTLSPSRGFVLNDGGAYMSLNNPFEEGSRLWLHRRPRQVLLDSGCKAQGLESRVQVQGL